MRFARLLLPLLLILALGIRQASAQDSPRTRTYNIDPSASSVTIQVFRAGLLAVLAHDHILTVDGLAGRVLYDTQDVQKSSLQVSVPVASLIVDDPEQRKKAGVSGELSEKDVAEIRQIIMSEDYLDEAHSPRVVATALQVAGELPTLSVSLSVRIKGTEKVYTVPVEVAIDGGTLRATGEVYLKQTDFGMKPYTAVLGAIAVEDAVLVKFDLLAREQN